MEVTDQELVEECLAGSRSSFDAIIGRYSRNIYGFVMRLIGSPADAEDIVQEVFFKAWKKLRTYDQKQSFKGWLFGIARNASIDWLRKKRSLPFSLLENEEAGERIEHSIPDAEPLPPEVFERKELAGMLDEVMKELLQDYREVLLLRYVHDLSFQEISEATGRPMNTVKSQHRRALAAMRELLDGRLAPNHRL